MPHSVYSGEEITRRGEKLYERVLRDRVEIWENIGKIISVDIDTGAYAIGDDPVETGRNVLARHPNAAIYGKRIGYDAVFALGGTLTRTSEIRKE